jgi:hypothetical protein
MKGVPITVLEITAAHRPVVGTDYNRGKAPAVAMPRSATLGKLA